MDRFQALLGVRGQIHQVDIQLQEGVDRGEAARQLRTKLGPSVRVVTPQQREQQAANLMNAFRLNLTALSLISLFVGVFLVHTTTQAGLVRRRSEFGLLRSLGATRGQVLGIILAEVITLGLLGVLLGLPLGYWVAQANVDMVSSTLTNLYLLDEIESLQIPSWFFALAIAIGIGAAAAGALLPALDMSRRDTKSLMTAFTLHGEGPHTGSSPFHSRVFDRSNDRNLVLVNGRNLEAGWFCSGSGASDRFPSANTSSCEKRFVNELNRVVLAFVTV